MRRTQFVGVVVVVVLVGVCAFLAGRQSAPKATTTSTTASSTTITPSQPLTAIWPFVTTTLRFTSPTAAAASFATSYLGFTKPELGRFQAGDGKSGEVSVRPSATGAVTTILLRQLTADHTWWVLGAATHDIQLRHPETMAIVTSPVQLSGLSTAFEAVVNLVIRQDGALAPLTTDTVMGGSMGTMGPFAKAISFQRPTATAGAIVMRTLSAKDGSVVAAMAQRVLFAP